MQSVRLLSGIGDKGPACMQLNLGDRRWLLDCGFGPEAHAHFDPAWLDGLDGHPDQVQGDPVKQRRKGDHDMQHRQQGARGVGEASQLFVDAEIAR